MLGYGFDKARDHSAMGDDGAGHFWAGARRETSHGCLLHCKLFRARAPVEEHWAGIFLVAGRRFFF